MPTLIRNWFVQYLFLFRHLSRFDRCVFIPTQIINFGFIPPHLRFVFVGFVSLCWSRYLHPPFRFKPKIFSGVIWRNVIFMDHYFIVHTHTYAHLLPPLDTYLSAANSQRREIMLQDRAEGAWLQKRWIRWTVLVGRDTSWWWAVIRWLRCCSWIMILLSISLWQRFDNDHDYALLPNDLISHTATAPYNFWRFFRFMGQNYFSITNIIITMRQGGGDRCTGARRASWWGPAGAGWSAKQYGDDEGLPRMLRSALLLKENYFEALMTFCIELNELKRRIVCLWRRTLCAFLPPPPPRATFSSRTSISPTPSTLSTGQGSASGCSSSSGVGPPLPLMKYEWGRLEWEGNISDDGERVCAVCTVVDGLHHSVHNTHLQTVSSYSNS